MASSTTISPRLSRYKLNASFSGRTVTHVTVKSNLEAGQRRIEVQTVWETQERLGSGAFGVVWRQQADSGLVRAVKVISRERLNIQEVEALIELQDHPDLFIRFFGWFEHLEREEIHIAMEYIEYGHLGTYIAEFRKKVNTKEITIQILEGLVVLHEREICHRDLKPQNILIASLSPIWVKITDFGISKRWSDTSLKTHCGTAIYRSPEQMGILPREFRAAGNSYTNNIDIWALGAIVHEMLTLRIPFLDTYVNDDSGFLSCLPTADAGEDTVDTGLLYGYCHGMNPFPCETLRSHGVTQEGIEFVKMLMAVNPSERLTAPAALASRWLDRNGSSNGPVLPELVLPSLSFFTGYSGLLDSASLVDKVEVIATSPHSAQPPTPTDKIEDDIAATDEVIEALPTSAAPTRPPTPDQVEAQVADPPGQPTPSAEIEKAYVGTYASISPMAYTCEVEKVVSTPPVSTRPPTPTDKVDEVIASSPPPIRLPTPTDKVKAHVTGRPGDSKLFTKIGKKYSGGQDFRTGTFSRLSAISHNYPPLPMSRADQLKGRWPHANPNAPVVAKQSGFLTGVNGINASARANNLSPARPFGRQTDHISDTAPGRRRSSDGGKRKIAQQLMQGQPEVVDHFQQRRPSLPALPIDSYQQSIPSFQIEPKDPFQQSIPPAPMPKSLNQANPPDYKLHRKDSSGSIRGRVPDPTERMPVIIKSLPPVPSRRPSIVFTDRDMVKLLTDPSPTAFPLKVAEGGQRGRYSPQSSSLLDPGPAAFPPRPVKVYESSPYSEQAHRPALTRTPSSGIRRPSSAMANFADTSPPPPPSKSTKTEPWGSDRVPNPLTPQVASKSMGKLRARPELPQSTGQRHDGTLQSDGRSKSYNSSVEAIRNQTGARPSSISQYSQPGLPRLPDEKSLDPWAQMRSPVDKSVVINPKPLPPSPTDFAYPTPYDASYNPQQRGPYPTGYHRPANVSTERPDLNDSDTNKMLAPRRRWSPAPTSPPSLGLSRWEEFKDGLRKTFGK